MNLNINIIFGQDLNTSLQISNTSLDSLTSIDNNQHTHQINTSDNLSSNNIISDKSINTQLNLTWTIATRNIQGIVDTTKRDLWFQYCNQQHWDIIITTETNGTTTASHSWKTPNYKTW